MYRRNVVMSGGLFIIGMLICIPTNDTIIKLNKNQKLINYISKEYKIDVGKAEYIVSKVEEGTLNNFPSKIDVLSIIAIESKFKAEAVSKKGALGWMQIKYKKVQSEYENILAGVELLTTYNKLLGSEKAAIQAYNVGIKNYKDGVRNEQYYQNYFKTKKELTKYEC